MAGCCEGLFKIIFIILNIIFFIIGTGVLGLGIWLKVAKNNLFEIFRKINLDDVSKSLQGSSTNVVDIIAILMIVVGVFTFVVGFCGCCGACKEIKCLLYIYAILVSLVVIFQIGIGIYTGVKKDEFLNKMQESIQNMIKADFNGYLNDNSTAFTLLFTSLMNELKCCGASGRIDFNTSPINWSTYQSKNPVGCCVYKENYKLSAEQSKKPSFDDIKTNVKSDACLRTASVPSNEVMYQQGCVSALQEWIKSHLAIIIGVTVGFGLFEIAMIIIAICLARKEYEQV